MSEEQDKSAREALENLRMRLLDLTGRNRLINYRHTKTGSLRMIDELPDQLVETLLSDVEMRFLPVPEPTRNDLIKAGYIKIEEETRQEIHLRKDPTAEEWAKHLGLSTAYEVPKPTTDSREAKHSDKAIQTLLYPYELETRLKSLLHTSESAIQEMGANILYMAFGFLEWFDNSNENARIAPLFLVPVRLHKGRLDAKSKTYIYTLSYSGEDIIPNLSLREKLRVDFALALPDLDENTTPEEYFKAVESLIQDNQPRWRVRRYITLTLLNFSKLLMYLDLDPSRWPEDENITDHPVITRFLTGYDANQQDEDRSNGDLGFGEEHLIDEMDDIHEKYPLIDDADSSQHSALIDAINGKDLVIEGPPGTGKSQTITNLIAAAMAQGKRVLFVAEKLAALEVVRHRLDVAGLGEFCLELHSHKSQKRKVLEEVGNRLTKHGKYRKPRNIDVEINGYEESKTFLKEHVERINLPWKNTGKTLHEIFMAATRYREKFEINPDAFHPFGYDGDNYDAATQRRAMDQVVAFRKVYQAVTNQLEDEASLQDHPWCGVRNTDLQIFDLDRVKAALAEWKDSLDNINAERSFLATGFGCDHDEISDSLDGMTNLQNEMRRIPILKGNELLDLLPTLRGKVLMNFQRHLQQFEEIQQLYRTLEKKLSQEVLQNLSVADGFLAESSQLFLLVTKDVNLGSLSEAINLLKTIQEQLAELNEPITKIQEVLDEKASKHLLLSTTGLKEFKVFVSLVAELNPAWWKHRDQLFDNEELDDLLPKLRVELAKLNTLHNNLVNVFNIDDMPAANDLRKLKVTLDAGGIFRWLKKSWRTTRRQVLAYAANSQPKFSTLKKSLADAVNYKESRSDFDENPRYKKVFGEHLNGLKTDVEHLSSMRDWYRKVRQEYGVGFGKKVALGEALFDLPDDLARGLSSLSDRGVQKRIDDLLRSIASLKDIFTSHAKLNHNSKLLIGDDGVITLLLSTLEQAVQVCHPLMADNSLTIAELVARIEQFRSLEKSVNNWESNQTENTLFQERLDLKTGVNEDNSASLSALCNTLTVATSVEQRLNSNGIFQYIYDHPTSETFSMISTLSKQLNAALETQKNKYESFEQLSRLEANDWFKHSGDQIDKIIARNNLALDNGESLQNWLDYVRVRNQLAAMGLEKLAVTVEQGDLDITQVEDAHLAGVYDVLAREIFREQPELSQFSGRSQEAIQDKFKEYDNRLKQLQCKKIAWKIDQTEIPEGNFGARVSQLSERKLIEKECSKITRHIPIRELLCRAGKALVALKPCFMMGPMSVAQYLKPGQLDFDLVIMDEASQIKPQDALGAIARGSQIVVVGDPKQLPPTSFFDRVIDDDQDDPTGIEDSESILDATQQMFQARRLRWHYRSQHESLIAFSNHSFYDSDLVIFPSPNKQSVNYGIQYTRMLHGCFVNRKNMEEVKEISMAVREHFRHHPDESLGVVAMNVEQRLHIERAIEALAKEDIVFRDWLEKDASKVEPLFVKNLENVQGDERDVIYISMTYGPQEPHGKVYQRFGPINSDGGWRRLNVLFTRSKKRMHIFSSMSSDDIVAGPTAKRGVQALKDFLSYCETGNLNKATRETERPPDSDFEIAVMAALNAAGFECAPQVGVAGFFIDLAVIDPGNPGRYLMGIECDGASYHSAKSTRDRDRLRQTILERLGWRIRRIWSTDWFKNPLAELQPIIRELKDLKTIHVEPEPLEEEPETKDISNIIDIIEEHESVTEGLVTEKMGLADKLVMFNEQIIRTALPDTPDHQRLLRPAMREAFVEYQPCSKSEFLEYIPSYLRQATHDSEEQFLDDVLTVINANVDGQD